MHVTPLIWVLLQVITAAGSAVLSYCIMAARMEVALARKREALARSNASLKVAEAALVERVNAVEQQARHESLDEFMRDFRVEERHYIRERKTTRRIKKLLVLQERICFRSIPLSDWIEHQVTLEDGCNPPDQARSMSLFRSSDLVSAQTEIAGATGAELICIPEILHDVLPEPEKSPLRDSAEPTAHHRKIPDSLQDRGCVRVRATAKARTSRKRARVS